MNNKVIGIIGGMGPEATANLFMKIIKATKVKEEQEHFRVIIDSNPKIPDRTKAILGKGQSPVNAIVDIANNLDKEIGKSTRLNSSHVSISYAVFCLK